MNRREYLLTAIAGASGGYVLWDIGVLSAPDGVDVSEVSDSNVSSGGSDSDGDEDDSGGGLFGSSPDWSKTAKLTHDEVNELRAEHAANELRWSPALADMAGSWAERMADLGELEHRDNLNRAADSFGAPCMGVGENIGQTYVNQPVDMGETTETYSTPQELAAGLVDTWEESSGHRQNMLEIGYTQSGVGVFVDGDDVAWAVQNFC